MKRIAAAVILATSPAAWAAGPWDAGVAFQLSAFRADAATSVRLDSDGGRIGTGVSLESDLGVTRTKTLPQFSYVRLDRSGSRTISGSIDFGDQTFPINSTVDSSFESAIWRVAYRYAFIQDAGNELAVLLGLHYTTFDVKLSTPAGTISESASVDVPLPTIGVRGGWRFADNLRLTGFAQFLKLKVGDYDGSLVNASAAVEWAFHPNAYAGLGYMYYKYELDSSKGDARGQFDYKFDGPTLYAAWAF